MKNVPHTARRPFPAALRRVLLSATALAALTACAHEAAAVMPLPTGWGNPPPASQWPRRDAFDWGVPAFTPPSATSCHRSPTTVEQPGVAMRPARPSPWARDHAWRLEERADARAESADGARPLAKSAPERPATDRIAGTGRDAVPAAGAPVAPSVAAADSAVNGAGYAGERGAMQPGGGIARRPSLAATVTAGMVDDNADFAEYLAFRDRGAELDLRRRDIVERYRVEVRDASGRPVPDAELAVAWNGGGGRSPASTVWARSDAGGTAWLHPRAVLPPESDGRTLEVQVRARGASGGYEYARATLQRGQRHNVVLRVASQMASATPKLDLVFLVDATGSMADEIAKLKASMASIADQIGAMPGRPDLCFGLVGYRDRTDAFITRTHDLTDRLPEFQQVLGRLQAEGGGDYPEAVNEALVQTMHHVSWRGDGTTRIVVMIGDAPPHLDYGGDAYDATIAAALAKGIKLHAVGASGLDAQGEAVWRQMAQYTGGRFVFLTYRDGANPASGPGSETSHDVRGYSVDTLDQLVVRLVKEELDRNK